MKVAILFSHMQTHFRMPTIKVRFSSDHFIMLKIFFEVLKVKKKITKYRLIWNTDICDGTPAPERGKKLIEMR